MNHSLEIIIHKLMNLEVCDFPMFTKCGVIIRAACVLGLLAWSSTHTNSGVFQRCGHWERAAGTTIPATSSALFVGLAHARSGEAGWTTGLVRQRACACVCVSVWAGQLPF